MDWTPIHLTRLSFLDNLRSSHDKELFTSEMNQHRRRVAGEPPSTSKRWQSTTKSALEEVNALRSSDDREVMIKALAERKMANTQTSISFGNEKVNKYVNLTCFDWQTRPNLLVIIANSWTYLPMVLLLFLVCSIQFVIFMVLCWMKSAEFYS